jgi:hypothetical protein
MLPWAGDLLRASSGVFALTLGAAMAQSEDRAPDKSHYTILNPTPVNLRRAYNTDRPSKTDSPFTIDAGAFQIESDIANWTLDSDDHIRTRTWIIGNTNLKVGLTNWMDPRSFLSFTSTNA